MAPYHFDPTTQVLVTLAIGFAFGFVLERAGFGNARNLAAQFYLYDMRVLKVMFTAIVTAMLLVFAASALGLLDFGRVWVPPTYFWPGVVGGFVLGIGFIIGGYCPGTSLVSSATLKIDGMFFAAGVFLGLFAFSETVPLLWQFWNHAGAAGRLTLFDWLGVDAGVVVTGVVLMAIGAFWFAEQAEKFFGSDKPRPEISARTRLFRRAAVVAGLLLAVTTAMLGQPTLQEQIARREAELDQRLASREVHIDPAELLGLIYNDQVPLLMIDVRDEADYNLFHLVDARRMTLADLETASPERFPPETVVVVMSNDEQAAGKAWKRLAARPNVNAYVLAGGVNRWLDIYDRHQPTAAGPETSGGDDTLRHHFAHALGQRLAAARPDPQHAPKRPFAPKVKLLKAVAPVGGGCG